MGDFIFFSMSEILEINFSKEYFFRAMSDPEIFKLFQEFQEFSRGGVGGKFSDAALDELFLLTQRNLSCYLPDTLEGYNRGNGFPTYVGQLRVLLKNILNMPISGILEFNGVSINR